MNNYKDEKKSDAAAVYEASTSVGQIKFAAPAGIRDAQFDVSDESKEEPPSIKKNDAMHFILAAAFEAWKELIAEVSAGTGVPQRTIRSKNLKRPSTEVHDARCCLVQTLRSLCDGTEVADTWLKLHGYNQRRINRMAAEKLSPRALKIKLDVLQK
jgi:hypothetical protein